ncbi:DUF3806 domain-containing protein [Sessilibacter sp. MAH2]
MFNILTPSKFNFSKIRKHITASIALLAVSLPVFAQFVDEKQWPKITPLTPTDEAHLVNQRDSIDELTSLKLGTPIKGNKSDLETLQRIIDQKLIPSSDRLQLQALGVVLGDQFQREYKLEWRVYEDQLGRSRALCFPQTEHCIFPITMLSRRMEAGLSPNVSDIYAKTAESLKPLTPKLPYSVN